MISPLLKNNKVQYHHYPNGDICIGQSYYEDLKIGLFVLFYHPLKGDVCDNIESVEKVNCDIYYPKAKEYLPVVLKFTDTIKHLQEVKVIQKKWQYGGKTYTGKPKKMRTFQYTLKSYNKHQNRFFFESLTLSELNKIVNILMELKGDYYGKKEKL
jgi:hypothetical protein